MSTNTLLFYRARAEEMRSAAAEATLSHVRERCERSEAAWTQLADRAEATEHRRSQAELLKATAS
jgi:hypothetical protein